MTVDATLYPGYLSNGGTEAWMPSRSGMNPVKRHLASADRRFTLCGQPTRYWTRDVFSYEFWAEHQPDRLCKRCKDRKARQHRLPSTP
jgi:hypothetical protein